MNIKYKQTVVHYEIIGNQNPVIVYLHGWGMDSNSFRYFVNNISATHILIDFPPFGKSKEPQIAWTVKNYAKMVACILKKHNIKSFSMVSHSFGTRVAIYLNSFRNINIEKLVITGGAGLKPKNKIKKAYRKVKYKIIKLFNKNALIGSNDYKILSPVMKKTFSNIVNQDLSNLAKQINCKTLIIYGKKDKETPIYMAKKFNKLIQNSTLKIYKNCNHFAFLQNKEQFLLDINIFLKD
ncbi:MAG: alpha/beta hydrolase [Clostridia bacterium]|nr:alpha/beta hydrolase [Clostridia bacterium]